MPISPYAGNPATFPPTIGLVDDSVLRNATNLNVAPQGLADRTANLQAHKLAKDSADTVTGALTVAAPGSLEIDAGATERVAFGGSLEISGTLQFDVGSDISGTAARMDLTIDAGTSHLAGGQVACDAPNSIQAHAAGAIVPTVAAGITDGGLPGGIQTTTPGGLKLGGGPLDFPAFTTVRTKTVSFPVRPIDPMALDTTHWLTGGPPGTPGGAYIPFYLQGQKTTTGIFLDLPIPHQGALLASVSVSMIVVGVHAARPLNLPYVSLFRQRVNSSAAPEPLSATDPQYFAPAPADGAAWHNGGNVQLLTYNTDVHNTIDNANYIYFLAVCDENGAGSASGNAYIAVTVTYTNIPDMRFPS